MKVLVLLQRDKSGVVDRHVCERPRLIIGLDFGTTWSAAAWALESCPGDIEVVQSWPGGGNRTTEKTPTLISYHGSKITWGHQIDQFGDKSDATIQGVKLLLDKSQTYRYAPAAHSQKIIDLLDKTPVDVVGDYLRLLVAHTREVLKRRFADALQTMDLYYILTVPAIWSDAAKDATMRAALQAGISRSNLTLLSEPEAAAVYAVQTIQPNALKENDCLIVCDAGGGTVDIITYCIKQTEPLRFSEVTEGTGAPCGSVMLDERFEALLKRTFQCDKQSELPRSTLRAASQYWQDYVKPKYAGPLDDEGFDYTPYRVPLPGIKNQSKITNLHEGFWFMEQEQVKEIFDPIVNNIEDLIARQWEQVKEQKLSVKAIILVGGLGSSEYLFRCLQTTFDRIEVMQPKNAWSAVVRGAVYRGQEGNQVDNRIARFNYGVNYVSILPRGSAKEIGYKWCEFEEVWKHGGCMSWYITKGMALTEEKPIHLSFYRIIPKTEIYGPLVFQQQLLFSATTVASSTLDSSITTLCEVEADLSKIPIELFDKQQNSKGVVYYRIYFDLVLTPASASLIFELHFNGVSYGAVRSRY